jgi:hypothetical protein
MNDKSEIPVGSGAKLEKGQYNLKETGALKMLRRASLKQLEVMIRVGMPIYWYAMPVDVIDGVTRKVRVSGEQGLILRT